MVASRVDKSNIGLIGFMATGKTSIGKVLSKSLGMKFIDLDKLIEERMDIPITEIFSIHGEGYFRKLEKDLIREISGLKNTVISYGGGACLDPENINNIRKNSKVVLLEARPEEILKRTSKDETRPLLNDKKSIEDIEKIMKERLSSYSKAADIIVDTSDKGVNTIRDEILTSLNLK